MANVLIYLDLTEEIIENVKKQFSTDTIIVTYEREDIPKYLKDADVFVTFQFTKEMLEMASNLKWLQVISAGVDSLPLEEIFKRGIILTNGRGIHKIHMAEYAMGAMISMARNFPTMLKNQLEGNWDRRVDQGEIHGATVGILGMGSIGEQIAKLSKAFGMNVLGVKRTPAEMDYVDEVYSMDDMGLLFKESDYLINLLPTTKETHEIIGKKYLQMMKKTAVFINIGRGTTMNEPELVDVLKNKKIRGYFSDVFYEEPLPKDSELWKLDNVVITPHICGVSPHYNKRAMEITTHNLKVFTTGEGEMINVVTEEKGY
ncbi:D-2-hydroxyacid dehydrogenase [Alkalicella caledoniensis]|uniref:D-2-hydroxyacid dehydrogenase n=1 Tax=Alkalicella caledoniensis TaxID=2731377 RepID=A0A7G9WBJ4_ALKCA|nr:D-2-hydroxyacid dehydrogenase [Alkalicella caledoniensis]QNO16056.1 D-2-hydroxyacid dehydrogenase [Alkalicella caledoniensis]